MTGLGDQHAEATVCILLPTFNDADYLKETIASVLAQSYGDFTLVVLDNASTDHTSDVVAGFDDARIDYVRHPENLGFLGNLNHGFARATGRYVVVQNSDDLWTPDFLARTVERMEADPELAAVHTAAHWIDPDGTAFGGSGGGWPEVAQPDAAFLAVLAHGFTFAAALFRRDVIAAVTPLKDPAFTRIADTELMLRTCLKGPIGYVDDPLCLYRVHDNSMSLKMYGSGEFFRLHLAAVEGAFAWPETQAAGLGHLRGKAMEAVSMEALKMIHVGRETGSVGAFLRSYAGIVRIAPRVLLRPGAWLRLGFGLLPRGVIRRLRAWRRAKGLKQQKGA